METLYLNAYLNEPEDRLPSYYTKEEDIFFIFLGFHKDNGNIVYGIGHRLFGEDYFDKEFFLEVKEPLLPMGGITYFGTDKKGKTIFVETNVTNVIIQYLKHRKVSHEKFLKYQGGQFRRS